MATTIWKGTLAFQMITIPVKVTKAAEAESVHFNKLHAACGSRINMKTVCQGCGSNLSESETVKGYEYQKDKYITVSKEELKELEPESDKALTISSVCSASEIDPLLFEDSYYLEPELPGMYGYKLLVAALEKEKKVAVARMVMHQRQHIAIIRPYHGKLMFHTMYFADEIRSVPAFNLDSVEVRPKELELARQLLNACAEPFDHAAYKDGYREEVQAMLSAKIQGAPVAKTVAKAKATPAPISLEDMLRASLKGKKRVA
jgi:DNA end-binding protein Ku